ncbi:MAG: hypothetical protein INR70_33810 [Parafilimonas terrae]|jgi:hypothetical protein|nr:hypothetical protein [Parafilimonas terrae]
MPRFFVTTADHVTVTDEQGVVVQDLAALRDIVRRTLTELLRDEGAQTGANDFTAEAHDAHGRLVLRARASFHIVDQ